MDQFFGQKKIGDSITAEHKVVNEGCESRNNHRYSVVVQCLATMTVQDTNLPRDGKEFAKVSRTVREAESQLH